MPLVVGLAARFALAGLIGSTGDGFIGPIAVDSSNVESISYDKENQLLFVTFKKNGEYVYKGVSESVFKAFLDSPSKGTFVHNNLINKYDFDRL